MRRWKNVINRKPEQGFTILEQIIIVIILGILAATSVPSVLSLYNRNQVDRAVNQVRGLLLQAQREAIRDSQGCNVTLRPSNDPPEVESCLSTRTLPEQVNINPIDGNELTFQFKGNTKDDIIISFSNSTVETEPCLEISEPLGIIRQGKFDGDSDECQPQS